MAFLLALKENSERQKDFIVSVLNIIIKAQNLVKYFRHCMYNVHESCWKSVYRIKRLNYVWNFRTFLPDRRKFYLTRSDTFREDCMYLDNQLSGEAVVNNIVQKVIAILKFLYRQCSFLEEKLEKSACSALIQCHLDMFVHLGTVTLLQSSSRVHFYLPV